MGLLSHLWHVINREIIAESLQWLETTQIPGNYAFIPTPRPHFSLCLPVPCPSHTRSKVWWRQNHPSPPVTWKLLGSIPDLAFPSGEEHSHSATHGLVSQHSRRLRAFPRPRFQEAGLSSLRGFRAATGGRSLGWCHFHSRLGYTLPVPEGQQLCSVPRAAPGTLQNRRKRGLSHIHTQGLFLKETTKSGVLHPGESHSGSFLVSVPLKASLGFAVTSWLWV